MTISSAQCRPHCSWLWNAEILRGASLSIILSWERTTKPLIRLCGCVGWSAPLMFACSYVRFSLDTLHKLRPPDYENNQASVIIIFNVFTPWRGWTGGAGVRELEGRNRG